MKALEDLGEERQRVLDETRSLVEGVRCVVKTEVQSLDQGIKMLVRLRNKAYEQTNQLPHQALILEAATELEREFPDVQIQWYWNPQQTGTKHEPDLQGKVKGKVKFSVEATASELPVGGIGTRMTHTLRKLEGFPGKRLYYVRTAPMCKAAKTKVEKAGYDVEVRLIAGNVESDACR